MTLNSIEFDYDYSMKVFLGKDERGESKDLFFKQNLLKTPLDLMNDDNSLTVNNFLKKYSWRVSERIPLDGLVSKVSFSSIQNYLDDKPESAEFFDRQRVVGSDALNLYLPVVELEKEHSALYHYAYPTMSKEYGKEIDLKITRSLYVEHLLGLNQETISNNSNTIIFTLKQYTCRDPLEEQILSDADIIKQTPEFGEVLDMFSEEIDLFKEKEKCFSILTNVLTNEKTYYIGLPV